jgi:hypothetical protein
MWFQRVPLKGALVTSACKTGKDIRREEKDGSDNDRL